MDISLAKLGQIVAVARAGSFSRAAAELNVSQPALSRSIALIEQRYGFQIFDRGRRGAALTSSGAQIVEQATALLRNARILDHNLKLHGRGDAGLVALGMGPMVSSLVLPELGKFMIGTRPAVRLKTLIRPTDILIDALLADEIELFIGPGPIAFPNEIECQEIGRQSAAFVVRATHPLLQQERIRLDEVLDHPLGCSVEISWAERLGVPSGAFICDNLHIIREIVLDTDVVWVCPPAFVARELESGVLSLLEVPSSPLTDPASPFASIAVHVARLKGRSMSPLAEEVLDYCRRFFTQGPHGCAELIAIDRCAAERRSIIRDPPRISDVRF